MYLVKIMSKMSRTLGISAKTSSAIPQLDSTGILKQLCTTVSNKGILRCKMYLKQTFSFKGNDTLAATPLQKRILQTCSISAAAKHFAD